MRPAGCPNRTSARCKLKEGDGPAQHCCTGHESMRAHKLSPVTRVMTNTKERGVLARATCEGATLGCMQARARLECFAHCLLSNGGILVTLPMPERCSTVSLSHWTPDPVGWRESGRFSSHQQNCVRVQGLRETEQKRLWIKRSVTRIHPAVPPPLSWPTSPPKPKKPGGGPRASPTRRGARVAVGEE